MKNYEGYIKHLESQVKYWKEISAAEREKNMKLEDILKKLEEKIYGINKEEK